LKNFTVPIGISISFHRAPDVGAVC